MRWLTILILGSTLIVTVLGTPARAQVDSREGIALQNQIYQLRQELQQLRDQTARGGGSTSTTRPSPSYQAPPPGNDLITQLLSRVDALEDQVRGLRGQIDQTQHQQQQQAADLGKRIDDLAFQVNPKAAGDTALIPPSTTSSGLVPPPMAPGAPPSPPPPPSAAPVRRTPELAIQDGNTALARGDYSAAEQAAREVMTNARTSPRAYDAQFLLAQALAGEKQFPQAAIAFDDSYNRSRKGAHAQDSLVGLASTLTSLNERRAACDTLAKLATEFPQLRQDLRDSVASVRQRAGCR